MIAIILSIWIPIIGGFNIWDYFVTRHGGKPPYVVYWIVKGMAAIIHGAVCLIFLEDQYYDYGSLSFWQLVTVWAPYLGYQALSFWVVYELVRNWWTGKYKISWLYYDTEEKDSGWIDRVFAWLGPVFHAFAKVMALAIVIFCIILICTRH